MVMDKTQKAVYSAFVEFPDAAVRAISIRQRDPMG